MSENDSLGDRAKAYEQVSDTCLTRRIPCLLRMDGKSFHTWTKGLKRPYDDDLRACMEYATYRLCKDIEGARFAYTQSDEITILLVDYQTVSTEPFFGYRIQKMVSVTASMCTAAFFTAAMKYLPDQLKKKGMPKFDARAFTVPKDDVSNVFLWRMQDCVRNSIQSLGRSQFSHKELHGKSCEDLQEMLFTQKNINWNDTPTRYKRGVAFYKAETDVQAEANKGTLVARKKWVKDFEMPILTQNFDYVNKWVVPEPTYDKITPSDSKIFCEDL